MNILDENKSIISEEVKDLRDNLRIDKECFSNWEASIRTRIKTANDTSSRSRYCLIFLSLVSVGFIMSLFSYFYSWNRDFAFQYLADKKSENMIRDGIIKEWLSTQTYQMPILGIKIMASDIQIFGPLILLTVSTWLYYEVRREHFTVGRLLGDIYYVHKNLVDSGDTKSIILSQEVYHNLIGYTVFNVIPYDKHITNLGNPLMSGVKINKLTFNLRVRRLVIKFLAFTPILSLIFIALTRILSFTVLHSTVTGNIHSIGKLAGLRVCLLALSISLVLISFYICYINIKKIYNLDNATRKLLDDFQHWAFEGVHPTGK